MVLGNVRTNQVLRALNYLMQDAIVATATPDITVGIRKTCAQTRKCNARMECISQAQDSRLVWTAHRAKFTTPITPVAKAVARTRADMRTMVK